MNDVLGNEHHSDDGPGVGKLPRLRSHAFSAPTSDDIRRALSAAGLPRVDLIWRDVCAEVDVSLSQDRLSLEELQLVTSALIARGGVTGLVGRAVHLRHAAYREIAARGLDLPPAPFDWARRAMDVLIQERVPIASRMQELVSVDPFAPGLRPEFDQAAARAAARVGTPLGAVAVLLDGAQGLLGQHGFPEWIVRAGGGPSEWSFCAVIQRTKEPFVLADARDDAVHRLNPMVLQEGLGSYAGAPMITSKGEVIGTCCVMDMSPRAFDDDDLAVLVEEAQTMVAELERRRDARGMAS